MTKEPIAIVGNHQLLYSPNSRDVDKSWTKKGSFIAGWKDFAALHYGIAPRRLEVMDPQQRLLIEATRWAIQDAGYETREFDRRRAGAFFGVSVSEFKRRCARSRCRDRCST
jgi:acyl transferase domain-containing protein